MSSHKGKAANLTYHEKTTGPTAEETVEFNHYLQLRNLAYLAQAQHITI